MDSIVSKNGAAMNAASKQASRFMNDLSKHQAELECRSAVMADAARAALKPPSKCRTRVEVRLGKSAKKVASWVAVHRKALRAQVWPHLSRRRPSPHGAASACH